MNRGNPLNSKHKINGHLTIYEKKRSKLHKPAFSKKMVDPYEQQQITDKTYDDQRKLKRKNPARN